METTVSIVRHHRVYFTSTSPGNHGKCRLSRVARISEPNTLNLVASPSSCQSFSCCLNGRRPKGRTFSSASDSAATTRDQLALVLEVDGVLVDAYRMGNRKAFNKAFQKLGLDCANWTEPIYTDLARKSDGDEEMMLVLYFNRIGWPSSLPTSEKSAFVKSDLTTDGRRVILCSRYLLKHCASNGPNQLHDIMACLCIRQFTVEQSIAGLNDTADKKSAMDEFMMSKDLPFRPGIQEFIDDACERGIPVVILTAYSKCGEKVARSIIERLGEKRTSRIKIVDWKEVEQSLYGQLVLGKGMLSGLDEQLSKEVRKAASAEKQRIAEEVASLLKLRVELDTSSLESSDKVVTALRAAAEFSGAPCRNCILIAGSLPGVRGSERVGMPCIVVRNSFTARVEIPSTSAVVMDGFGEPDLTISRLQRRKWY